MENIEKKIKENQTRNKKFIKEFEEWLKEKSLSDKTIKNLYFSKIIFNLEALFRKPMKIKVH